MTRWDRVFGIVLIVGAVYDMFSRDWLSSGQYLCFGVGLLLGPNRPGRGRVPAVILSIVGIGLFAVRVALRQ